MATKQGFLHSFALKRDDVPSFKDYPFSIPAIKSLRQVKLHPSVTFFVGENGSGKSTLVEGLAVKYGFNAEGGTKNFNFSTRESHSPLHDYLVLDRNFRRHAHDGFFLRAESFFNVATEIEKLGVSGYGDVSLHEQSHGESFFAMMENRLSGDGIYIFDEPEAALSPQRQLAMLVMMDRLLSHGAQLIIATHSPILLAYPDALIYEMDDKGMREVAYTDCEPYRITRDFLNRTDQMLDKLLDSRQGQKELRLGLGG